MPVSCLGFFCQTHVVRILFLALLAQAFEAFATEISVLVVEPSMAKWIIASLLGTQTGALQDVFSEDVACVALVSYVRST